MKLDKELGKIEGGTAEEKQILTSWNKAARYSDVIMFAIHHPDVRAVVSFGFPHMHQVAYGSAESVLIQRL